jgi:hypothetical protein
VTFFILPQFKALKTKGFFGKNNSHDELDNPCETEL